MATTTNLGLTLPTVGADDDTWGTIQNTLSNGIDAVFAPSGTAVSLNIGAAKSLNLGGAMSAAAWTTAGVKIKQAAATYTDTSSSGTVADTRINNIGAPTLAASSATVYTNAYGIYFADPVAGTNVTLTAKWAAGFDSIRVGTSNALTVSPSGVLTATSPVLVTPALGTPASGTLTSCTGLPISTGVSGLGTGVATLLGGASSGTGGPAGTASPTFTGTMAAAIANFSGAVTATTLTASSNIVYLGSGSASIQQSGNYTILYTSNAVAVLQCGNASDPTTYYGNTSHAFRNAAGSVTYATFGATGAAITGTTTNDSAAAGKIGEYVTATVLAGSAVSLTTATAADITSISLTAGDWDVEGCVVIAPAGGTSLTRIEGWTSSTSATQPTIPNNGGFAKLLTTFTAADQALSVGRQRFSLSATTTVYLSCYTAFSASTCTAYGFISARRAR